MKAYKYKIDPQYLIKVKMGLKKQEFRKNDRKFNNVQRGDLLILVSTEGESNFAIVEVKQKHTFWPKDYDQKEVYEMIGENNITWNFFQEYYKQEIEEDKLAGKYDIELVITNE